MEDWEGDGAEVRLRRDVMQLQSCRLLKATPPEVGPVDKELSFWWGITNLEREEDKTTVLYMICQTDGSDRALVSHVKNL